MKCFSYPWWGNTGILLIVMTFIIAVVLYVTATDSQIIPILPLLSISFVIAAVTHAVIEIVYVVVQGVDCLVRQFL